MKSHLKRLRKRHEEGEEWAVSFADMMTLLMCFFILMVSISAVDIERYEQVAESLGLAMKKTPLDRTRPETGALTDTTTIRTDDRTQTAPDVQSETQPEVPAEMRSDVRQPAVQQPAGQRQAGQSAEQPEEQLAGQPAGQQAQVPAHTTPAGGDEDRPVMAEAHEGATSGAAISGAGQGAAGSGNAALDALMSGLEERLQGAGSAMQIERRANSVAIRLHGPVFFALASAELTQASLPFLNRVAEELKANRLHVSVEGHTDDLPIVSDRFPSNWELSAGRAASVARHLIGQGVEATRLDVRGYAHVRPLVPNLDAHGTPIPGNRELNRRVMIVISSSVLESPVQ
ncbi:OmpA family protein [Desulfovibrio subterraneus]|uniref:flagellar motor protein MotB n=1 Tax=Desulfovibrio subterraneus TaxID=2718620 RepID=UPI0022B90961|nr:flagellar motor protein MotB [Desulfovibrio subterraneus]WBF68978.1 OmpA family protein [Desulfovibrio subterraneus]